MRPAEQLVNNGCPPAEIGGLPDSSSPTFCFYNSLPQGSENTSPVIINPQDQSRLCHPLPKTSSGSQSWLLMVYLIWTLPPPALFLTCPLSHSPLPHMSYPRAFAPPLSSFSLFSDVAFRRGLPDHAIVPPTPFPSPVFNKHLSPFNICLPS